MYSKVTKKDYKPKYTIVFQRPQSSVVLSKRIKIQIEKPMEFEESIVSAIVKSYTLVSSGFISFLGGRATHPRIQVSQTNYPILTIHPPFIYNII